MPLSYPSNLASKDMAHYLLKESRGKIGKVCRIVKEAAIDALQNGEETISLECLKRHAIIHGKDDKLGLKIP